MFNFTTVLLRMPTPFNSDLARIFDDPELAGIGLRPLSAAASTVADSFLEYSAKQESFV